MSWGNAIGAGVGMATTGLSALYANRERRKQQQWNLEMLDNQQGFANNSATIQYNRETDYKGQMDKYIEAGINPYMVASKGVSPGLASSPSAMPYQQAKVDFGQIGQHLTTMAQVELLQAQADKTEAERRNIEAENPFIGEKRSAEINALNQSIEHTRTLITSEQGKQKLQELEGIGRALDNKYKTLLNDSELQNQQQNRYKSIQEIKESQARINFLGYQKDLIKAQIDKLNNDIETGKITQEKIATEINNMIEKLPGEIKAIDRSNQPIYNPKGLIQDINSSINPRGELNQREKNTIREYQKWSGQKRKQ